MSTNGIKDGKVQANVLATMVGVTPRDIQLLCKNCSITAEKIGGVWYIPFPKGLQDYIKIYKDKAEGRGGVGREELDTKKLKHETELKEAKAEIAKIDLAERTGKVHNSEIVEEVLNEFVFYVRSGLLAVPSRVATSLYNEMSQYFGDEKPSASIISTKIADEINIILGEFANYQYNSEKMEQKRKEKLSGDMQDIEDDDDE